MSADESEFLDQLFRRIIACQTSREKNDQAIEQEGNPMSWIAECERLKAKELRRLLTEDPEFCRSLATARDAKGARMWPDDIIEFMARNAGLTDYALLTYDGGEAL